MNVQVLGYKGRLRVRVAGLLKHGDEVLLVQMHSPVSQQTLWMPPGGGVEFGESLHQALEREFLEETNLKITVGELRYTNELLEGEFHAIEFFFDVTTLDLENLSLGFDPEHETDQQILKDIRFVKKEELAVVNVEPKFLESDYWLGKNSKNF